MGSAVGQKYSILIRLENGSGHSLTITPRDFIGDPDIGAAFGPGNVDAVALMDGRDAFLAYVDGPEQAVSVSFDLTDFELTDHTDDDLGNFLAFSGDYVKDIGQPGNPGSYPTFKTIISRTVAGRVAKRTISYCKGSIATKTGAERNTITVTIEGYGLSNT